MDTLSFTPKSEKELQEQLIWPKSEYDFEVVKAEPKKSGQQSKNPGTPYIALNLKIYNEDGASRFVNGILHPAMEAQLRHFCYATGLGEVYESGSLRADHCEGRSGKLKLKIEEAKGDFPAKNVVQDYIVPEPKAAAPARSKPASNPVEDLDEPPF